MIQQKVIEDHINRLLRLRRDSEDRQQQAEAFKKTSVERM